MAKTAASPQEVIDAIQEVERSLGATPSKAEFRRHPSGMSEHYVVRYFPGGYNDAVRAAGLTPNPGGKQSRIDNEDLLREYGRAVRRLRGIPARRRFNMTALR